MREAVESYIREMTTIRGTGAGTSETSYYPPLRDLLNAIGATLRPPAFALSQLRNTGRGLPDFGLFTREQRHDLDQGDALITVAPSRA